MHVVNERVIGERRFSVSTMRRIPADGIVTLSVKIWRGNETFTSADCDGQVFSTEQEAREFCKAHGYTRRYYRAS